MKKYLVCLLLLTFLSVKVCGQEVDAVSWTTVNTFGLYDSKNNKLLSSFDINASLSVFNGGIGYKNITYADSKKLSFYAGLGMGSLIQFQAGFSKDGFSIRNRYDLQVGLIVMRTVKPAILKYITITPVVEKYFKNPHMNWYFGVGTGLSINNFGGFKFFKHWEDRNKWLYE